MRIGALSSSSPVPLAGSGEGGGGSRGSNGRTNSISTKSKRNGMALPSSATLSHSPYPDPNAGRSSSSASTTTSPRRRKKSIGWSVWVLGFFALVVLGTFIVLSTAVHYFGTHADDFITLDEIKPFQGLENVLLYDRDMPPEQAKEEEQRLGLQREKIPRIIHQTWKNETLPERWVAVRKDCERMLPDYEYMLWTDASSREFIASTYPDFLATWDSYPYNIQRADAIRYFVLHRFGGIYMDLDIGCRAHPGPLMHFQTILPVTKPVGLSNDLIFSAPGTAFMDLVIHSLDAFNHEWLWMNYPAVMFSTGPMFISALYGAWYRSLGNAKPGNLEHAQRVRILPKSLYGKNAPPEEVPHSFFWHYYGSSWHASDAGFVGFLGKYGYRILLVGSALVFAGFCYVLWSKRSLLPFSPKLKTRGIPEPFQNYAAGDMSASDKPLRKALGAVIRTVSTLFKPASPDDAVAYAPVPTHQYGEVMTHRAKDSDAVSLHSICSTDSVAAKPGANGTSRLRAHTNYYNHPATKKPHGRQRSRDVERASPVRARSSSNVTSSNISESRGYFWPESATSSAAANGNGYGNGMMAASSSSVYPNPYRETLSPEALERDELPRRLKATVSSQNARFFGAPSRADAAAASLRPPAIIHTAPLSSSLESSSSFPFPGSDADAEGPSRPAQLGRTHSYASVVSSTSAGSLIAPDDDWHSRKHSDASSSELLDLLTDLEPVVSASTARGATTPRELVRDAHSVVRKRSMSGEGERFSRAEVAGSPR